jgi:formate hydrogenlyase subunit 3/multisubunit Na+/H+ antiporter MnhD subunit
MKLLVDFALPERMPRTERKEWENTRHRGRTSFILTALLVSGVPIVIFFPVQGLIEGVSGEVLRNYIVVTIVLLGGIVAIANAMWKYKEAAFSNAKDIETKH